MKAVHIHAVLRNVLAMMGCVLAVVVLMLGIQSIMPEAELRFIRDMKVGETSYTSSLVLNQSHGGINESLPIYPEPNMIHGDVKIYKDKDEYVIWAPKRLKTTKEPTQ